MRDSENVSYFTRRACSYYIEILTVAEGVYVCLEHVLYGVGKVLIVGVCEVCEMRLHNCSCRFGFCK